MQCVRGATNERGTRVPARVLLRLPAALHAALAARARRRGLSLNEYLTRRLAAPEPAVEAETLAPLLLAGARAVAGDAVRGLVLHGSWARGEARRSSDVDAIIVVDRALPLTRALYRAWDRTPLEWDGRPVDVHFVHVPSAPERASGLWCELAVEGQLLADTDHLVHDALIGIRRAIAEGRLVRKRVHGQPYWTTAA